MELVEGVVRVGTATGDDDNVPDHETVTGAGRFPDVDAFVTALDEVAERHGVTVQAFDARYVVSRRHLARALELADRERDRGDGIARERAVEVLLYVAGRRQIDQALELGIGVGETPTVVLVDAPEDGSDERDTERSAATEVRALLDRAETLGYYNEDWVREYYDVGQAELAATDASLEELVLERVALLVVER